MSRAIAVTVVIHKLLKDKLPRVLHKLEVGKLKRLGKSQHVPRELHVKVDNDVEELQVQEPIPKLDQGIPNEEVIETGNTNEYTRISNPVANLNKGLFVVGVIDEVIQEDNGLV